MRHTQAAAGSLFLLLVGIVCVALFSENGSSVSLGLKGSSVMEGQNADEIAGRERYQSALRDDVNTDVDDMEDDAEWTSSYKTENVQKQFEEIKKMQTETDKKLQALSKLASKLKFVMAYFFYPRLSPKAPWLCCQSDQRAESQRSSGTEWASGTRFFHLLY